MVSNKNVEILLLSRENKNFGIKMSFIERKVQGRSQSWARGAKPPEK